MTTLTCPNRSIPGKKAGALFPSLRACGWARRFTSLLLALGFAFAGVDAPAALTVNPPGTAMRPRLGDDELNIDEVFHSHLPTTLEEDGLRLAINPRLGDLRKRDHLRVPIRARYGLTERIELSAGVVPYFSHGQGDVPRFDRHGIASFRFGGKINLGEPWFAGWETAAGFDCEYPTGHPPAELTDGLRHFRPYVTFSHRFEARPDLRVFVGFRLDLVDHTSVAGHSSKYWFREHSAGITGGWVLDRDRLHYTFEASYDTTRAFGGRSEDVFSIRPGVIWEVPRRGNRPGRGNWMVGAALSGTFGPEGSSLGASFKLRFNSDLMHFRRVRSGPVEP
jgi:hypothetical protein